MQYSLTNSEQAKEFRKKCPGDKSSSATSSSPLDQMRKALSSLTRMAMGGVEEGFRGSVQDTKEINNVRKQFDKTISEINNEYAKTVTHTGKALDKFGEKVGVQQQMLIDTVKDAKWRSKGEQQLLNSISARKEDSEIYQRMGSAKYTVYSLIALVIVGLTMTHMDLNLTAYLTMALVLSGIFLFILTVFYWKKSIYSTS
jgi:hypothetical protein